MNRHDTPGKLIEENWQFDGTGGVSQCNDAYGFIPAFRDEATGYVYPSCYAGGLRAPVHLYDGLPDELIVERAPEGRPHGVKASVISGFLYGNRFYTRAEAAQSVSHSTQLK